jgi:hypothetical protein
MGKRGTALLSAEVAPPAAEAADPWPFIAVHRGFMLSPVKSDTEDAVPGVLDFFLGCLCKPIKPSILG